MTITTDISDLYSQKDVAELAIKIRSHLEYMLRVLDEEITSVEEGILDPSHRLVPKALTDEEGMILGKVRAIRDDMKLNHSEYLTI